MKDVQSAAATAHRSQPDLLPLKMGVSDQKSDNKAAMIIRKAFGKSDVFVSNVGIFGVRELIADFKPDD